MFSMTLHVDQNSDTYMAILHTVWVTHFGPTEGHKFEDDESAAKVNKARKELTIPRLLCCGEIETENLPRQPTEFLRLNFMNKANEINIGRNAGQTSFVKQFQFFSFNVICFVLLVV